MNGIGDLLGVELYDTTRFRSASNTANQAYQNALAQNQLLMQQAGMTNLAGLANMPQPKPSNVTPIRPERTPEQIREQLEARMAEMEAEAERLRIHALTACSACRWRKGAWCKQPLVIGIKQDLVLNMDRHPSGHSNICGPEKALWEPIPTRWQRLKEWFVRMIERAEGTCHKAREGVNR